MRKIYNTLLCFSMLVFTFITFCIVIPELTFAVDVETDVSSVPNGEAQKCGSGNCYSLGTGGIRLMLLDKDGKQVSGTNIVDYWLFDNSVKFFRVETIDKTQRYFYFSTKRMKQSYQGLDDSTILSMLKRGENYSIRSINSVAPGILTGFNSNFHWEGDEGIYDCSDTNDADKTDCSSYGKKANTRVANVTERIMNRIVANAKGTSYGGENFYGTKLEYLDNILIDMGLNGIEDLGEDYYLQVEPLTQWGNDRLSSSCGGGVFFGTPTEFSLMIRVLTNTTNRIALFDSGQGSLGYTIGGSGYVCVFNKKNTDKYFELATIGIYTQTANSIPNELFKQVVIGEELTAVEASTVYNNLGKAYGVGFISLKEFGQKKCSSVAINYIDSGVNEKTFKANISSKLTDYSNSSWLSNYEKYGFKNLTDLKKYLGKDSSCPEPSCNESAQNFITKKNNVTSGLNEFIEKYPHINSFKNIATNGFKPNFDLIVAGINKVDGNYCAASSCATLFEKNKGNEKSINILYSIFNNKYPLLNKEFREELGISLDEITGDKACKQIPKCDPGTVTASCSPETSNTITFTDSDKLDECVKSGYAYTISSGDVVTKVQSSKESDYNLNTYGNVYCSERVDINLPKDVKTKAGNLLAWGNNNQESDVFGKMKLVRTCYFPELYTKNGATIKSEWVDDINPFIQINYEQALPEGMTPQTLNERLGIRKRLFKIEDTASFDEYNYTIYDVDGTEQYCDVNGNDCQSTWHDSNNPTTITCAENSCNKLNSNFAVTFTLDYDIIYKDTLKWYSNKSNHFEYSTSSEITRTESEIENNYTYIGYGLPTSFSTATTCLNTKYGYSKDSSDNGKLYLTIKNIGTKNSSGGYHFDKIISTKYHVTDDSSDYTIMENDQRSESLVYSCGFTIQNELFGYEDGDGSSETCANKPPKGIDVVFRTVDLVSSEDDLTNAFPGRSGTGRKKGRNWANLDDEEVAQILSNDIYDREPLYEITLNSSLIQKIRSANNKMRASDKDPYSDMTDETKQGSVATESNGYSGYQFSTDEDGIVHSYSAFLYNLAHTIQCDGQGCLKQKATTCINSSGQHTMNCYQQWWNE